MGRPELRTQTLDGEQARKRQLADLTELGHTLDNLFGRLQTSWLPAATRSPHERSGWSNGSHPRERPVIRD
jgi:hypothetical protein